MRRTWWVMVVVLALAGCGTERTPTDLSVAPSSAAPSGSPAEPETTGTEPRTTAGAAGFVSVVRERVPEVAADRRDEEIEDIARRACASLAAGDDADAVVAETRSLGTMDAEATDQATARELIKLAIDTVCPDQDRRVDDF